MSLLLEYMIFKKTRSQHTRSEYFYPVMLILVPWWQSNNNATWQFMKFFNIFTYKYKNVVSSSSLSKASLEDITNTYLPIPMKCYRLNCLIWYKISPVWLDHSSSRQQWSDRYAHYKADLPSEVIWYRRNQGMLYLTSSSVHKK